MHQQYIRFRTTDPEGFALVKLEDISGIYSTAEPDICRLVTAHGEQLVVGSIEHFSETMGNFCGSEWSAVQEVPGE